MAKNNSTGSKSISVLEKKEKEDVKLLLRIVLLFSNEFKDYKKDDKYSEGNSNEDDEQLCVTTFGNLIAENKITIENRESQDSNRVVEEEYIYINETATKNYANKIKEVFDKITKYKITYNDITLEVLIPTDNGLSILSCKFLKSLLKDSRWGEIKFSKDSNIQCLQLCGKSEDSPLADPKPSDLDAKMAAIMSHYVYFYLDWLEYYHVHRHDKFTKKSSEFLQDWGEFFHLCPQNEEPIEKKNITSELFENSEKFTSMFSIGANKVKFRIVKRLKEITQIVGGALDNIPQEDRDKLKTKLHNYIKCSASALNANKLNYYTPDADLQFAQMNFEMQRKKEKYEVDALLEKYKYVWSKELYDDIDKELVYINDKGATDRVIEDYVCSLVNRISDDNKIISVLKKCHDKRMPLDLYELYDNFGYWGMFSSELQEEAKNWHVSHPYLVCKYFDSNDNTEIEDYKKVHWGIIPIKTADIIFKGTITKEDGSKTYEYFNSVLTHGMDQLSGYGGLLFVKVKGETEPEKFAYCTKGTDVNSFNDWVFADVLQGLTGIAPQHIHNIKNAITIDRKVEEKYPNTPLFFCGHSLGGGLASAGAVASKGRHAITFNAAGLNFIGSYLTRVANAAWGNPDAIIHPINVTHRVHPIRIEGEAIDEIMKFAKIITGGLNERGYGSAPLIIKFKDGFLSELGAKHGINNFLNKPLLEQLKIVDKKTIVEREYGESMKLLDLHNRELVFQSNGKRDLQKTIEENQKLANKS